MVPPTSPSSTAASPALPGFEAWRQRFIAGLQARGSYPTWVLFAVLAGTFATSFPVTILTISLGDIARELGERETTVAWVLSAPLLLSAVALPLMGKLGDLYGHRRVFLTGFAAATVTAVATSWAWDAASLIFLRTLAAVVGGATQPTSIALLLGVYPPDKRVQAMGWWSMTGALAPAFGLVAGGPLVDWFGWRVVFLMQAGFSLIALALATLVLRETRRQRVAFDVAGGLALAVGVAGWMVALGRVREVGPTSPEIAVAIGLGILGLIAFVRIERRAPAPMLPLEFLRERNFSASILAGAFNGGAYMGAFAVAPLVFLNIFHYSITETAAVMLTRTAALTIASPFGGRLGARIGERGAAAIGGSIMVFSMTLIAFGCLWQWMPGLNLGLLLQGVGHGLSIPSLTSASALAVPEEHVGIAAAINRLANQIGVAFGITALMMVYGGVNEGHAFQHAFLVAAAMAAMSVLVAGAMRGNEA